VFAGGEDPFNAIYSAKADIFDTLTQQWTSSNISSPRSRLAAAAAGTKIVFAGGESSAGPSNVVDIYDVVSGTWTSATLSEARSGLAAAALGNRIYMAGGLNVSGLPSKRVDIYDVSTGTWSIDSLSQGRNFLSAGTAGNLVLFAGGANSTGTAAYTTVDILDTISGTWSVSNLSAGRSLGAATSVGDKFIIAGGVNSAGLSLNSAEIYTAIGTGLIPVHEVRAVSIYPIPSSEGIFRIKSDIEIERLDILGITGAAASFRYEPISGTVDLSSEANGIYLLKAVRKDGGTETIRIIKG
jgi:hypothetical protein